jgi:hypothetical protein
MDRRFVLALASLAPLGACRAPGPEVVSATEVSILETTPDIEGRDGGASALVWGRSVWVYGDTVLTVQDERDQNWHHNSVSWTMDLDASDGIGGFVEPLDSVGAPAHLIPPSPDEQAFNDLHAGEDCAEEPCGARWAVWPGAPIWDAERERALVFYGLIYAEPGDFNFEGVGSSIAIWTDPEGLPERPVIDPTSEHPDLLWLAGEPGWGAAAAIVDDWLYAFACDGDDGPGHACRLGRVELDELLERDAWRYLAAGGAGGADWSADMDEAEVLFEGAPILSIAWNDFLGAWLAVYSEPFSSKIRGRTAPELTGPWSRESTLYDAGEDTPYDALAHPEYEEGAGRVQYLSYSRPTTGWFGTEFPLVRVELASP